MLLAIDEVDNEDNSKRGQDDEDSSTPILIFGAVGRPDDMVLPGARRVRRVPTSDGLRDLRLPTGFGDQEADTAGSRALPQES